MFSGQTANEQGKMNDSRCYYFYVLLFIPLLLPFLANDPEAIFRSSPLDDFELFFGEDINFITVCECLRGLCKGNWNYCGAV